MKIVRQLIQPCAHPCVIIMSVFVGRWNTRRSRMFPRGPGRPPGRYLEDVASLAVLLSDCCPTDCGTLLILKYASKADKQKCSVCAMGLHNQTLWHFLTVGMFRHKRTIFGGGKADMHHVCSLRKQNKCRWTASRCLHSICVVVAAVFK